MDAHSLNEELFLGKISLPVYSGAIKQAVSLTSQIGNALSLPKSDVFKLELAIEEAIDNSVSHFYDTPSKNDQIHLEYTVNDGYLQVTIKEKGIPFYPDKVGQYDSSSIEGMEFPGLGSLLITSVMDKVEFLINGRHGKELRLFKSLKNGSIPKELIDQRVDHSEQTRSTIQKIDIRQAQLSDLPEITRLAWKSYGYTQERVLYDLDLFTEKIEKKESISFVAINTKDSSLIAHIGLKFLFPESEVAEICLLFKDPAYNTPGLAKEMFQTALSHAENQGLKGIFGASVTTHSRSQKLCASFDGHSCCLLLGIAAQGMKAKNLTVTNQQKGSVLNDYFIFDRSLATVYPPEHHLEMITHTYGWMNMPRKFQKALSPDLDTKSQIDLIPLPEELNSGFIIVNAIGSEFDSVLKKALDEFRKNKWTSVYVFLSLGDPACPFAVDKCERIGFSYAGIMPHIHNQNDRIILQYLDLDIDWNQIKIYSQEGKELRDYVKQNLNVS